MNLTEEAKEKMELARDAAWQRACDDWQTLQDNYRLNGHSFNRGFDEGHAAALSSQWVSVEDRLPKVADRYWVTLETGTVHERNFNIDAELGSWWSTLVRDEVVVAWAPIEKPAPFQEEVDASMHF